MTMQGWAGDCIALLNHLGIASAHVRAKRQKTIREIWAEMRGPKKNEREAPLGLTKRTSVVATLVRNVPMMRKTITIPSDASDDEIFDAVEELFERALELPVTLSRRDVSTLRKVIEAKRRRL